MNKLFTLTTIFFTSLLFSQNPKLEPYSEESSYNKQNQLNFIKFKTTHQVNEADIVSFINSMILNNGSTKISILKSERDAIGYTNTKYNLMYNNTLVYNKLIISHVLNGKLISLNGDLYEIKAPANQFSITESNALAAALKKINAKKYKWQVKEEEEHMRQVLNQPDFTYYPKATKVVYEKSGKNYYAYQFNIYAHEPLYRANVFVDASTGKILGEHNLICNIDVQGTALTKYSGTQTFTIDQNGGSYRLRETARGLGIETYNLQNSNVYNNVDFTNATTSWTTINVDQGARDAHWGAEKTYDYYWNIHNRNSIDNAGYKLLSYVHYNTNFNNAFWDGTRMTYGDGNGAMFTILTSQDVCGHEITHGLVSNTSNLDGGGTGEPDALNEAFADIFGTSIERYAKPGTWNWIMGSEITPSGNGIRNMSNPNSMSDPDTYGGTFWDPAGEPHNNAGPADYWFYLLVTGGSGTNDLGNAFNVTGLGNTDAEKIAFRALTIYFTQSTTYANARTYCIQAAKDLFGACSNQVIQTTNAWYAVGVGTQYSPSAINPNFNANITSICNLPANINFNNTTGNGVSYTWYFGDGSTSTSTNPVHSYTANGTYTVKLKALGCLGVSDSLTQNSYINVSAPSAPTTTGSAVCQGGTVNLAASGTGDLYWYASPGSSVVINTGTVYATPNINTSTTYYVVNSVSNTPVAGGIPSSTAAGTSGGYITNPNQWLTFNVLQSGTLVSVQVYAQNSGNRTIELRNSSNVVLNTTVVNLTTGANTVTLNYPLTPGTFYQLGLNGASASSMFRSNTGVSYPYNVGGVVSITGSSAGGGFYYWYYNWKVRKADCTSNPVAVTATVSSELNVTATAASTEICIDAGLQTLTGSPAGGVFSGQGITGNSFDPSVGVGTYTINYNYTDGVCSGTNSIVLKVSECTGINSLSFEPQEIQFFPNPASNKITISNAAFSNLQLIDASGRVVFDNKLQTNTEEVDISSVSKGIYFILIQSEKGKVYKASKLVVN